MSDRYYVYKVSVADAIVYIGKGQGDRHKHATSGRSHSKGLNEYWFKYKLLNETKPVVDIVEYFESEQDAISYEVKLIKELSPSLNIVGNSSRMTINNRSPNKTTNNKTTNNKTPLSLSDVMEWVENLGISSETDIRGLLYHKWYHCHNEDIKSYLESVLATIPDKRENNGGHNIGFAGRHFKGDEAGKKAYGRFKKKFIKDNEREPNEDESLFWLEKRNNKRNSK